MAKIPDGILGGFSGRIGNIVGVMRDGETYIRTLPSNFKDAKTPDQLKNRGKFKVAQHLSGKLKPLIKQTLSIESAKRYDRAFISHNMKASIKGRDEETVVEYQHLILSAGTLKTVEDASAERTGEGNLLFTWTNNAGESNAKGNDMIIPVAISAEEKEVLFEFGKFHREDEEAELNTGSYFSKNPLYVYIICINKARNMISNTLYLGEV